MNYTDFYSNAERRTTEALLSMWAAGKSDTQKYLKFLFETEPILAEPVFQSMFPWESVPESFEQFTDVFDRGFIDALSSDNVDKKYRYPKDRKPYIHQSESWKQLLVNQKSIVVTSGTGSGKTECFMMPIIQDLVRQRSTEYGRDQRGGVQAIFLYPLNALMSSQQKRMSAWCRAVLPQVTFAMYKGDTKENKANQNQYFPELTTRKLIRKTPPQILFTNPTMLEYMLVRKQDKPILDISREKRSLKWIVLDEAHSYSGSSAAELALQIRRILDAFGVTVDDVRFAATSATLGSGADDEYKNFISQVTGKCPDDIAVIHGKQLLPEIEPPCLHSIIEQINSDLEGTFKLTADRVLELRKDLIKDTLSATEIGKRFTDTPDITVEDCLKLIDTLSEKHSGLQGQRQAILPTRAHFFARNMGGLYACVNPDCKKHKDIRIDLGALTTYAQTECDECKSKLIEVNRCNSCGNLLLVGQEQDNRYGFAKQESQTLFEIESSDSDMDDEDESTMDDAIRFVLAKNVTEDPVSNSCLIPKAINPEEGTFDMKGKGKFVECRKTNNGSILCPHCGEPTDKLQPMYSGNLFSRLLAPILLEQTNPETSDETALWQGRKYISFTDNRQGTAKSTFQLNIEVERNWIRTAIYHYLSKERGNTIVLGQTLSEEQRRELALLREHRLNPLRIEELERIQNGQNTPDNPFKTFTEFSTAITGNSELKKLFDHLPGSFRMGRDETAYLKQLVIDQFGRRPLKAGINNPETMGLVRIVYPSIENSRVPDAIQGIFTQLGWTQQDWKDLLKISIDYCIRGDRLVFIPDECKRFKTQAFRSGDIYPSSDRNHNKKWPVLNLNNDDTVKKPHRLVVLLLLAMGIKRENEISPYYENIINQILDAIWNFLRINVLKSNTEEERGYKLDLLGDKVAYQIIDKAWICPVNQVPLDVIFRGYSPLVSSIIASNLEKYKITEPPVEYPYFPFAYRNDKDGNCVDDKTIINWMNENIKKIRAAGLWSNLHERILLHNPVYLSAEHTAQQNKETLRDIEQKFEENRLNILSCSTTMEMGVDISGISEVVMNNVPPKPANYLQRAGRAGRGNETKALAITFCAPDPVGSNLFNNPKWPMTHKTAIPKVSFDSNTLVQRHINSLLLAYYIAADGENDLTVRSLVENFFYPQNGAVNHYQNFLSFLNLLRLGNDAPLLESYQRLVKSTCKTNVVFQDAIASCYASLESIYEQLNGRITLLDNEIESLLNENYQENSPATLSLTSRKKNILRQDVLGFFAEHNFIPSAGIPTGIVEFNTYNIVNYRIDIQNRRNQRDTDEANENNFGYTKSYPSMLLTQAISEYAPGNQIIQNETCYISKGIVMRSQWDNARRVIFQHCPSCGFAKLVDGGRMDRCPDCGNDLQGIRKVAGSFVDFIEPAGYTVDFYTEPTRLITQTKKNYSQPELLNMPKWSAIDDMSSDKMQIRQGGDFSEILYYNLGNGYGYAVCIECGRAVPDISEENRDLVLDRLKMHNHSPIIGGKRRDKDREHCDDDKIKRHVLLGGRFQTDFVEIRLRNENGGLINDEETIYSLGVILTGKLAELIGINSQEISFGVKRYNGYMSIFIFDTAKGGAGYSIRFQELKNDVIDMAQKSLSKCQCKKSCDKCLINRNSQWVIDKLDRKKALEWLNQEISSRQIVPDYIKTQYGDKVKSLNVNLSAELNSVLNNPDLAKATFFINNKLDKWNPDSWEYIKTAKELRHRGIDVCFAFTKPAIDLKTLSASQLTVIGETKITFSLKSFKAKQDDLKPLVLAKYSSSKQLVCYFSERGTLSVAFDDTWATGGISVFKMPVESDLFQFVKWTPDFSFTDNNDKYIMFELRIKTDSTSRQLVNTLTGVETDKWKNIFDKVKNKSVNISYSDIYLNSPLACRLLIDVINGITGKCNFAVNRFDLLLGNVWSERPDDFDSTAERDKYLEEYSSNITCNTTIIKDRQLPHDRTLKFENPNFEFIVRPDGGFENGWTVDYKDKYSGWEDNYESDIKIHNKSVYTGGILYTVLYREK